MDSAPRPSTAGASSSPPLLPLPPPPPPSTHRVLSQEGLHIGHHPASGVTDLRGWTAQRIVSDASNDLFHHVMLFVRRHMTITEIADAVFPHVNVQGRTEYEIQKRLRDIRNMFTHRVRAARMAFELDLGIRRANQPPEYDGLLFSGNAYQYPVATLSSWKHDAPPHRRATVTINRFVAPTATTPAPPLPFSTSSSLQPLAPQPAPVAPLAPQPARSAPRFAPPPSTPPPPLQPWALPRLPSYVPLPAPTPAPSASRASETMAPFWEDEDFDLPVFPSGPPQIPDLDAPEFAGLLDITQFRHLSDASQPESTSDTLNHENDSDDHQQAKYPDYCKAIDTSELQQVGKDNLEGSSDDSTIVGSSNKLSTNQEFVGFEESANISTQDELAQESQEFHKEDSRDANIMIGQDQRRAKTKRTGVLSQSEGEQHESNLKATTPATQVQETPEESAGSLARTQVSYNTLMAQAPIVTGMEPAARLQNQGLWEARVILHDLNELRQEHIEVIDNLVAKGWSRAQARAQDRAYPRRFDDPIIQYYLAVGRKLINHTHFEELRLSQPSTKKKGLHKFAVWFREHVAFDENDNGEVKAMDTTKK